MSLAVSASPDWELINFEDIEHQEYNLFDSVISEFNDITGFPIEYFPLNISNGNIDSLYGENTLQEWDGPYSTKLVYEPTNETEILNAFGFSSDDTIVGMMISKSIFSRDVSSENVPKVGDTLKTLWNNKTYEIVDVGSESRIFNGKKMIWEFICKPFRYSSQSDSADTILFDTPSDSEFPEENFEYLTQELSAFGENDYIEEKSNEIEEYSDIDTTIYGYGGLE